MRPTTLAAIAYVVAVAVLATCGFASGSTLLILAAFGLALPTGAVALVGYYVAYGLLTQVPGVDEATAGAVLGVLAATAAAVTDVLLLRLLLVRRGGRPVDDDSPPGVPAR